VTTAPVSIRPMRSGDVDAAASLTSQLGYPVDAAELGLRLADVRRRTDHEVLVATDDADRAIGWIHVLRVGTLEASELAQVAGLVVDEGHREEGIGAALLAAAETWAREHGARSIVVRSRVTRERAHAFYLRHGYREQKRSVVFEKPLA
jgi:GNAT superfamily N-acetyltransferase